MNKIIKLIIVLVVISILAVIGLKLLRNSMLSELNGNEKIVSTSLDKDGAPKDILGEGDGVETIRNTGDVYMSVKTNKKDIKNVRVVLKFENTVIDDLKIAVSEAGYATYHFKDLSKYKTGLYQVLFYDSTDQMVICHSVTFK